MRDDETEGQLQTCWTVVQPRPRDAAVTSLRLAAGEARIWVKLQKEEDVLQRLLGQQCLPTLR